MSQLPSASRLTLAAAAASPSTFDFHGHEVRGFRKPDGSLWFIATDITRALGYVNTSKAIEDNVHPDDKYNQQLDLPGKAPLVLNESGMYSLVLRSRKPSAKEFSRWVTSQVLPSLRQHGVYIQGQEAKLPEGLSLEELEAEGIKATQHLEAVQARLLEIKTQKEAELAAAKARYLENRRDRDEAFQALKFINRVAFDATGKRLRKASPVHLCIRTRIAP